MNRCVLNVKIKADIGVYLALILVFMAQHGVTQTEAEDCHCTPKIMVDHADEVSENDSLEVYVGVYDIDYDIDGSKTIQILNPSGSVIAEKTGMFSNNKLSAKLEIDPEIQGNLSVKFYCAESCYKEVPLVIDQTRLLNALAQNNNDNFFQKTDFCFLISEACENGVPVELIPVECSTAQTPLPRGGTYEIFQIENNALVPRPDMLSCPHPDTCYLDPYNSDGNYRINYTYNDGFGIVTKLALFDVQALNPQIIIEPEQYCGNGPELAVRVNPIGGQIIGDGIVDSLIVGSNMFYFLNPILVHPDTFYSFSYHYQQVNASGLICEEVVTDTVELLPYPGVYIETAPQEVCEQDDIIVAANGASPNPGPSYFWLDPLGDTVAFSFEAIFDKGAFVSGNYIAVMEDINGCFDTDTAYVEVKPVPVIQCDTESFVECHGGDSGRASIEILNLIDTIDYTVEWSNGYVGIEQTNLFAGTYTVTVLDSRGCSTNCTVVVEEPDAFQIHCSNVVEEVTCFGEPSGATSVEVSGGTPPYYYSIDGGTFQTDSIFSNLGGGYHYVIIEDKNLCRDTCDFTLTEPKEIICSGDEMTTIDCYGDATGVASVSASGGAGDFHFLWSTGDTTEIVSGLTAGTYMVTATDEKGCECVSASVIHEPEELVIECLIEQEVNCFGATDGSLMVTVSGGIPGYSFAWSNGETSELNENLGADIYSVTVTDAKGCSKQCSIDLPEPEQIQLECISDTLDCHGDSDGFVEVLVMGGTGNYSYIWSTGDTTSSLSGLTLGNYTVTVTDSNGCADFCTSEVSEPDVLLAVSPSSDLDCHGDADGILEVTVNGGTGPYDYLWNTGDSTAVIDDLSSGYYIVTVSDLNGCQTTSDATVSEPEDLVLQANDDALDCFGFSNGEASVSISGGTYPYSFSWENGGTDSLLTDLSANTYLISVTDDNGCVKTSTVEVTQPSALSLSCIASELSCFGGSDALIKTTVIGGTQPYTYRWNTGDLSATLGNIGSGTYIVTVTDANGCTLSCTTVIEEPEELTLNVEDKVVCLDFETELKANITGGEAPYTVDWQIFDVGVTGFNELNMTLIDSSRLNINTIFLFAGDLFFDVAVTDSKGCVASKRVYVLIDNCFDLAIRKTVDVDTFVNRGELVEFKIEVFNQDSTDAYDVEITDYPQAELLFFPEENTVAKTGNEYDWVITGGEIRTYISHLPALSSKVLKIFLKVDYNYTGLVLVNDSHITQFSNEIRKLPIDEDDRPDYVTKNEKDDDIEDDSTNGVDNPEDEDRIDGAEIPLCDLNFGINNIEFDACIGYNATSILIDSIQQAMKDQLDADGDGDGDALDGDTGNVIMSFHSSQSDAQIGINEISHEMIGSGRFWARVSSYEGCFGVAYIDLRLTETPRILVDPVGNLLCHDETAIFEVTAAGQNLNYQWKVDDGSGFVDIPGANKPVLKIDSVSGMMDNFVYKCMVMNASAYHTCPVTSAEAVLQVNNTLSFGCNDLVNVSLNENCEVPVYPDMIIEGDVDLPDSIYIVIRDANGNIVLNNIITEEYLGQILNVSVMDQCSQITCWGQIFVEDKLKPVIECGDVEVSCMAQTYNIPKPSVTDNCPSNIELVLQEDKVRALGCGQVGYETYGGVRELTYIAVDGYGNVSDPCTMKVLFEKFDLHDIDFPGLTELSCSSNVIGNDCHPLWDINVNNYPDPNETGFPRLDGRDLAYQSENGILLSTDNYCHFQVYYEDLRFDICPGSYKILRRWHANDWCSGVIIDHDQIIKILDKEGPKLVCDDDLLDEIPVRVYACKADFIVPTPENIAIFDCSDFTYEVFYTHADDGDCTGILSEDAEFIPASFNGSNYEIKDLGIGCSYIKYVFTDACGNVSECIKRVVVYDNKVPIPVCEQNTVTTLSSNQKSRVFAQSLDDGSYDQCSGITFGIRRVDGMCTSDSERETVFSKGDRTFYAFEDFCCTDLETGNILVEMGVMDASGNINFCQAYVHVKSNYIPIISCPPSTSLACGADYTVAALGGLTAEFDADCGHYEIDSRDVVTELDCGEKDVTRIWELRNIDTDEVVNACNQIITIRRLVPYNYNAISYPSDRTIESCADTLAVLPTNPATGGYPIYISDDCNLMANTYEDQYYYDVSGYCVKVKRTWTVINWCEYDPQNPSAAGTDTHIQILLINNSEAPVIECTEVTTEIGDGGCEKLVSFMMTASDDCTDSLRLKWSYLLDVHGNGVVDHTIEGTNNFLHVLPVGTHRVTWNATDRCGNTGTCIQDIHVVDVKKPSPYCRGDLTTVLMQNDSTSVAVWASDFDLGSYDNCPGAILMTFNQNLPVDRSVPHYYKPAGSGTTSIIATKEEYLNGDAEYWDPVLNTSSLIFNCDDVGISALEIWVTDGSGNQDFCITSIRIQSNNFDCQGTSEFQIGGAITLEQGGGINDVEVHLEKESGPPGTTYTNEQGKYAFSVDQNMHNITVHPEKDDNYLNGVSTLDIVLIQRHILGIESLDSPYKLIAADANRSASVSAIDLIELRKLILGIYLELPQSPSWVFVDKKQDFLNGDDPWGYRDRLTMIDLDEGMIDLDFMGVKVGDVNNSYVPSLATQDVESRADRSIAVHFEMEQQGPSHTRVNIYARDLDDITGLQLALEIQGPRVVSIEDVISGVLPLTVAHVALSPLNDGLVNLSWHSETGYGVTVDDSKRLFALVIAHDAGKLQGLDISKTGIRSEAYSGDLKIAEIKEVEHADKATEEKPFTLSQNIPNPFTGMTTIEFHLHEDMPLTISFYSMDGKEIERTTQMYRKGFHQILFDASKYAIESGVVYYRLEGRSYVETRKMLIMKS